MKTTLTLLVLFLVGGAAHAKKPTARPLVRNEIKFLKEVAAKPGKLNLSTAAFAYGTGGLESAPARRGYITHSGGTEGIDHDSEIYISLTDAGRAFLAERAARASAVRAARASARATAASTTVALEKAPTAP
jgi:hypothetical protein